MKRSLIVATLMLSVATSQAQTRIDFDKRADFKQYKTFKFEPGTVIRKLGVRDTESTFMNQYVDAAITKDLIAKGLTPTNDHPDLVITYLAGAREKQQVQNYFNGPGMYPYAGFYGFGGWWGPGWNNFWVRNYEEGTVIFDVYDAKKADLVWRAYAVSSINKFNEERFVQKQVNKSFRHFPPRS